MEQAIKVTRIQLKIQVHIARKHCDNPTQNHRSNTCILDKQQHRPQPPWTMKLILSQAP